MNDVKRKAIETVDELRDDISYQNYSTIMDGLHDIEALKEGDKFIGIDNSTGNAWTEEFPDEASCLRWLAGEE